ncbi:MAG: NosD domain-containing protein, partial [Xanthomonadales bacterium]|nr:NosD domain-containing protein [Xanthomonadales bacterium]
VERLTGYYPAAVKIFNQTRRVTFRDNLIIDQPDSNGVWYDVGNREGVIVNNWIEGAQDAIFFEISDGVLIAGNVLVDNQNGVRVLNSANARVYHNTFVNSPALFERNGRSPEGDHFGWHSATGPGVDERAGHEFVNNLLAADGAFDRPLLHFAQPAELCDRLDQPMAGRVEGNAYVRPEGAGGAPLVRLSPARTDTCFADYGSLDALRRAAPSFDAGGAQYDLTPRSVFRGPDVGRYDLQPSRQLEAAGGTPDEVRALLEWSADARPAPGAYALD